jgi:thiamine biosynthesis lipoprotein
MLADVTFRAMGSSCRLVVEGPDALAEQGQHRIAQLERQWSRYLPDTEISRLNRMTDTRAIVSADTFLLIARGVSAMEQTDGYFDPTMLHDLTALGYDRSIEQLAAPRGTQPKMRDAALPRARQLRRDPSPVTVFPEIKGVLVSNGSGFDPGGIGKGLAGDIVASELLRAGATGVVVELGGDVRVAGSAIDADHWRVLVADPFDRSRVVAVVEIGDGAVATSSTLKRRWYDGEVDRHHVLDPSTRTPSQSELVAVTAVTAHGWWAEALAKAVLVAGLRRGATLVQRCGASVLAVRTDGRMEILGDRELIAMTA